MLFLIDFMKIFDLHCDTATRLLSEKQGLFDNSLHVSIKKAERYEKYAQVMAVWTNHKLSDADGYLKLFEVVNNLKNELELYSQHAELVKMILAVEDARILENDISRLDVLHSQGVRLLTLNWHGKTCIGGAHDTSEGLTDFGVRVVKRCFEIGIIPDVSHSSFSGTETAIEMAKQHRKPIIASHSDSYTVNSHSRNLRDDDFREIVKLGGLVGINLCPAHLSDSANADITDVIRHIEHYLSLGGENTVALGCDLDGTNLPNGFSSVSDLHKIHDELQKLNYCPELINKILYKNAFDFFTTNL